MRKNKFIYSLFAVALACIISFSGVGNSYIQVHATSVGIEKGVWNDDVSAWENIRQYIKLFASAYDIYVNPSWENILWGIESHNDFYNFMVSDGYTEEQAEETVHGGGGHVRDGISVDDDGNVTYSDEVSDLFYGYIKNYLDSNSGYLLFKTIDVHSAPTSLFSTQDAWNNFIATVENFGLLSCSVGGSYPCANYMPTENIYYPYAREMELITKSYSKSQLISLSYNDSYACFYVLEDDWTYHYPFRLLTEDGNENSYNVDFYSTAYSLSNLYLSANTNDSDLYYLENYTNQTKTVLITIFSDDGRNIKLWYDLTAFKNYDVGNQMYYVTDSFNNYNSAIDNSTTITSKEFAYYYDNSSTIFQTVQNNINNYGGELDEKTVQDIVDSAVQDIKDSIANSGNQGGNDSGDSDNGGSGVGDLVDGIGKLLDTILSLIGKVMGVVADFTQSILDLFSGFTDFTDGFSSFLSGAFSFIPQEIWNVIQVGLSLMILLAIGL